MQCPGQDKAYWKGERVFELPCPKCGAAVEFFRDENARRCSRCGYKFSNARVALECAAWCDQAEACLGYAPARGPARDEAETALAGRMIQALEESLPHDPAAFARAVLVFEHAKELVAAAKASPRLILPAALLLEIGGHGPADPAGGTPGPSGVAEILSRAGLDQETIESVSTLIASYHASRDAETAELAILRDAHRLASLVQEGGAADPERLKSAVARDFQTEAGKARARQLFER